ncbi:MAG: hypothetical protein IJ111_12545 [Eggerthellaceae bacterium]|nr:hypothetical protein [Eggerthellaceae bacterium]
MRITDTAWRTPALTPELGELVDLARKSERELQLRLGQDDARRAYVVRRLIVGNAADACDPRLDMRLPLEELCEQAVEARGPLDGGTERKHLRERARLCLHLSRGLWQLGAPDDLLELWDIATRREPLVRNVIDEPRWRTADDPVPFTGGRMTWLFGVQPLRPECATADPRDIGPIVESTVSFVCDSGLPPELVAFGASFPMFFAHPFVDGNGHTSRLLACDTLHKAGYSSATLLALLDRLHESRLEISQMIKDVVMGNASSEEFVAFYLGRLTAAQEAVMELLDSSPAASR